MYSVLYSTLIWVVLGLVLLETDNNYDVLSVPSLFLYLALTLVGLISHITVFAKSEKGVQIGCDKLEITTGIFERFVPSYVSIDFKGIVSCESISSYKKNEDENRNKRFLGLYLKNIPMVKIKVKANDGFGEEVYYLPLDNCQDFVKNMKICLND